jgi:hypothetical protein
MKCKCPYPETVRIGDDAMGKRLLHCMQHGFSLVRVPRSAQPEMPVVEKIPSLRWRKAEYKKFMSELYTQRQKENRNETS